MSKTTAVATGRMVSANGQVVNLVDVLGGGTPVSEAQYDIDQYAPHSGLVLGEDGKAYDLTRMLADVTAGSGGGQVNGLDALGLTVENGQLCAVYKET